MTTTELPPAPELIGRNIDLLPLIECQWIVLKDGRVVRLGDVMTGPQRRLVTHVSENLNAGRPTRVIILKARQLGMSTIIQALNFVMAFLLPRMRGMTIAHKQEASDGLLGMTHHYWDTCPWQGAYTEKSRRVNQLWWTETNSKLTNATAGSKGVARSQTLRFLHLSEAAFYDNPETLWVGVSQSIAESTQFSFVFIESTANGVGNWFEKQWNAAVSGDSDYIPFFFPWQIHDEYRASANPGMSTELGELDEIELQLATAFKASYLPGEAQVVLSRSAPDLAAKFDRPMPDDEIADRLAWRRHFIANKLNGDVTMFQQEYPTTPEEAFIATGRNIFPVNFLRKVYEPEDPHRGELYDGPANQTLYRALSLGDLRVYRAPALGAHYAIGADPSRTTGDGDFACAQVVNRHTWEQVAMFRARLDGSSFAEPLIRLGHYFNDALIGVERQGDGVATNTLLVKSGYDNLFVHRKQENIKSMIDGKFGWDSNIRTKALAVNNARKMVLDGSVKLHDSETFAELRNYVDLGGGKYGNSSESENDDCASAWIITMEVTLETNDELVDDERDHEARSEMMLAQVNEYAEHGAPRGDGW